MPSFEDGMGSILLSVAFEATVSWPQLLRHHIPTHALPAPAWLRVFLGPACHVSATLTFTNILARLCWDPAVTLSTLSYAYLCIHLSSFPFAHLSIHTAIHQICGNVFFFLMSLQCFRCLRIGSLLRYNLRGCGDMHG